MTTEKHTFGSIVVTNYETPHFLVTTASNDPQTVDVELRSNDVQTLRELRAFLNSDTGLALIGETGHGTRN